MEMDFDYVISAVVLVGFVAFTVYYIRANFIHNRSYEDMLCLEDRLFVVIRISNSGGVDVESFSTWKYRIVDLKSGETLFQSKADSELPELMGVANNLVWIKFADRRFVAIDPYTFKTVFEKKDIRQIRFSEEFYKIAFTSDSGTHCTLDCSSLKVTKETLPPDHDAVAPKTTNPFKFKMQSDSEGFRLAYKNSVAFELPLLNPKILILLKDESVVLLHYSTLDERAEYTLLRIDSTGRIGWTLDQKTVGGHSSAQIDFRQAGAYLLAIEKGSPPVRMFSIAIETGEIVWKKKI